MNLYIRYFDDETLVYSVEEALHFLSSLDDVEVTEEIAAELEKFMASSALYPKHIKVRARSFFIVIKTTAKTMEEFKAKGAASQGKEEKAAQKEALESYSKLQPGWYAAKMVFKRVLVMPETQKSKYVDTPFICKVWANSIQECYDKVVEHLRSRKDIDSRSQYPGIKNEKFEFEYLGD